MTMNQIKAQTMAKQAALTQTRLQQLLDYDPDTGLFSWKMARAKNKFKAGTEAGTVNKVHGYSVIKIDYKIYRANRLAWFHYYGIWPTNQIHHINTVKTDNRIANLADVTALVNCHHKQIHERGHLLYTNFHKQTGKWVACPTINGKREYLGLYATAEEAYDRSQQERALHNLI